MTMCQYMYLPAKHIGCLRRHRAENMPDEIGRLTSTYERTPLVSEGSTTALAFDHKHLQHEPLGREQKQIRGEKYEKI